MDKQKISIQQKERPTATHSTVDEFQNHSTKLKEARNKESILYDSIYIKFSKMKISLLLKQSSASLGVEAEGEMDCMGARGNRMIVLISQVNTLVKDHRMAPLVVCNLFFIKQ